MNAAPFLSVVIPVLDEDLVLPQFLAELQEALDGLKVHDYELIFVDDGSRDDTWKLVVDANVNDSRVRGLSLSRNFGHQAAVSAGLEASVGEVVVVMDGDMQDDPHAIGAFLEGYRAGHDVVYAIRVDRTENWWHRIGYWVHYRVSARVGEITLPVDAGDFGLMSRRVVDEVNRLPERLRYVRGLRAWVGYSQIGVPVPRRGRFAGRSKYSFRGLLRLSTDGLLGFSVVPLRISIGLGIAVICIGVLYAIFVIVDRLTTGQTPAGFASLALLSLLLNGTVLVMLGIVGEYVGRIYMEVKDRPVYLVTKRVPTDNG